MNGARVAVAIRPIPRAVPKRLFDGVARLENRQNEFGYVVCESHIWRTDANMSISRFNERPYVLGTSGSSSRLDRVGVLEGRDLLLYGKAAGQWIWWYCGKG